MAFLVFLLLMRNYATSQIIKSVVHTNMGAWGTWQNCEKPHQAIAFQILVDHSKTDGSGINGVALLCCNGQSITSQIGPLGSWSRAVSCGENSYLKSFQVRSTDYQFDGDDLAITDLRMSCSGHNHSLITGHGVNQGKWRNVASCPPQTAICAIRTQVEMDVTHYDKSGTNNINFQCCQV
jgi:hypothetical protein